MLFLLNRNIILYFLDILTNEFGEQKICLHRDGSLSCFEKILGPDPEKIKKKII